jgi:tripartite-type tricarboxylate transporter receptor subunit TctC
VVVPSSPRSSSKRLSIPANVPTAYQKVYQPVSQLTNTLWCRSEREREAISKVKDHAADGDADEDLAETDNP